MSARTFPFPFPLPDATSPPSNPVSLNDTDNVTFGLGRVEHRLHSSSRVLVNSQELDPGVSRDVLAAYLQVTSSQGSEGTVGSSIN